MELQVVLVESWMGFLRGVVSDIGDQYIPRNIAIILEQTKKHSNHDFQTFKSIGSFIDITRLKRNGWHWQFDSCRCAFLKENYFISARISHEYVCKGPMDKLGASAQVMICHQTAWTNYIHVFLARRLCVNSMAPGRPGCHFKTAIFSLVLLIGFFRSSYDNALRWMPWDLTNDKSTLVQVMAWCCQATSHYLSQSWPSSV